MHNLDRSLLTRLSESNDQFLRKVAQLNLGVRNLMETINATGRRQAISPDEMRAEMQRLTFMSLALAGTEHEEIAKQGFRDILDRRFARDVEVALFACTAMNAMNSTRIAVLADFKSRGAGSPQIDPKRLSSSFKLNEESVVVLTIRNLTDGDLHNCFIATHMKINRPKVDQHERQSLAKLAGPKALANVTGLNVDSAIDAHTARLAYDRIDKGGNFFIPEWKKGDTIEVTVALPDAVNALGDSIDAWVGCDEGVAQPNLDIELAKRVSRPAARPRTPARGRRR
jgi:hypothetical protein